MSYIHELKNWPNLSYNINDLTALLGECKFNQGRLLGKMDHLGFDLKEQADLTTLTSDIIQSSEIEGEHLNNEEVRSSVARHLGLDAAGVPTKDRHIEGIVEMLLDATRNYMQPLTKEQLQKWHANLFPYGLSGMQLINTGMWRTDNEGPMQVISGAYGRHPKIHFEAPDAKRIPNEMQKFLIWFNDKQNIDPLIKAAIAHLWFVTIHPFDDGNGRIARAIADMLLARSEQQPYRFYSMSSQIRLERKDYYLNLEQCQHGDLDITSWITWFLGCLNRAIQNATQTLNFILHKAEFWQKHSTSSFNPRQILILNKLFDGFTGSLTTSKWAKMCKCSQDTAARDITDLIDKGVLEKSPAGGRSTHYKPCDFPINQN